MSSSRPLKLTLRHCISCPEVTLYPRAHGITLLLLALAKLIYCLQHNLIQLKKKKKQPECKEKQCQGLLSSVSILPWMEMIQLRAPVLIYLLRYYLRGLMKLDPAVGFSVCLCSQHLKWPSLHNLKTTHSLK